MLSTLKFSPFANPLDLRYTAVWNGAMLQTEDTKAALLSGIQKTKPKFSKL
jgi:delta(3,5)-delta(2,4)-dienoyl-CoA isomerase